MPTVLPPCEREGLLNAHMLPGREAIWLTADPEGNVVTEAHLAYMRERGEMKLAAEHAAERPWLFGANEYGTARLTVDIRHVQHYLDLMRTMYADTTEMPEILTKMATGPKIGNWYVSLKPIPVKRIVDMQLTAPSSRRARNNEINSKVANERSKMPREGELREANLNGGFFAAALTPC